MLVTPLFSSVLHIVDVLATCEAVDDDLPPYKRDQIPSLLATDLPKLLVRDRVDAGPNCWVGRAPFPALAKVAGQQRPHRRGHPGRQVHRVRDVTNRDLVDRPVRQHLVPHAAWDPLMARADRSE